MEIGNRGPDTGAQQTAAMVANGYLSPQFSLREVLQNILGFQHPVPHGVVRIGSQMDSGLIAIKDGAVITGALLVGTGEWGPSGLGKLLSVKAGTFAYLSLVKPSPDVSHEMNVPIVELLSYCSPSAPGAPPRQLADALKALLKEQSEQTQSLTPIASNIPKQSISKEDIRATSQRLKLAAGLGVDLATASQQLKKLTSEQLQELSTGSHDSRKVVEAIYEAQDQQDEDSFDDDDDDNDEVDTDSPRQAKRLGWEVIVGAGIAFGLIITFGYQLIQAFTYRDHLQQGMTALDKGKLDVAQVEFSSCVTADPKQAEAYFYRAISEMKAGNHDSALKDYTTAIQLAPDNLEYYMARASLYNKIKDYVEAINDCEHALGIDQFFMDAYRVRAVAFNHLDRYSEAISDSNLFLKKHTKKDNLRAEALANRAYGEFKKHNFDAAISDLSEAIECNPGSGTLYVSRAVVYQQVRDWKKAVDDCNMAAKLIPDDPSILAVRGLCYSGLGMSENSLHDLDQLVKYHPTVETHRMRGDARLLVHDYDGALRDFQYVLDATPSDKYASTRYRQAKLGLESTVKTAAVAQADSSSPSNIAIKLDLPEPDLVKKGYDLMIKGQIEPACQYFTAAVRLQPNDAQARQYLAHSLAASGRTADALPQFAALAKLRPLTPEDQMRLADALIKEKRVQEAVGVLNTILAGDPKNARARVNLIKTYVASGDKNQADAVARQGELLSPAVANEFEDALKPPGGPAKAPGK